MSFLPKFSTSNDDQKRQAADRAMLQREAQIGGQLFGPVPDGRSRQFFCLDEYTWIWHESWTDAKGQPQTVTTRYEVRSNGIVKSQEGLGHSYLTIEEAQNLCGAIELYQDRVDTYYQQVLQAA